MSPWLIVRTRSERFASRTLFFVAYPWMLEYETECNAPPRLNAVKPFISRDQSAAEVLVRNHVFTAFNFVEPRTAAMYN